MGLREQLRGMIEETSPSTSILLELPTGVGKTYLSLIKVWQIQTFRGKGKVLVVVPKLVLIKNWKEEITKWGGDLDQFEFTTYLSLAKHGPIYSTVIFDEAHHLTVNNVYSALEVSQGAYACIFLSASINNERKAMVKVVREDTKIISLSAKNAIKHKVLPDPKVILVPLVLDDIKKDVECKGKNNGKFFKTEKGYYEYLSKAVEREKQMFFGGNSASEKKWLFLAGKRLKFLATRKTNFLKELYQHIKEDKSLTFCADTTQAESLGIDTVTSKNKDSLQVYEKFNAGEIKHIACVSILDEGVNITDCRIGIYAYIAASNRLIIQRLGRLLRHSNPVLIIPFFVNTRENEIVNEMMKDYNKDLVITASKNDIIKFI